MTGNELRRRFLEYFRRQGHTVLPSSPLVPEDDPTLLFTNAGMVQFKNLFLGLEKRPYRRATTAQKCVRAGGKHNDLETVGRTARHHTFFEMLGNFSFGDYFKEQAITFAWEFLTKEIGLPKERLWVTVYKDDDEAFRLWRGITGLSIDRIVRLGEKDNFWAMGDTGPCGPCSEIMYDRGQDHRCGSSQCAIGACDCDRWLEIWNLVFMQFERNQAGTMSPLPRPSIDTGMGLERMASVLQNAESNYETDLMQPLIDSVEKLCGKTYSKDEKGFPFRVIADHARSCAFLVSDGVIPGNEGRGYVLRRILRRAVRFGQALGIEGDFLHRLVPQVVGIMGEAYPDLAAGETRIAGIIRREEERFLETLEEGVRVATDMLKKAVAAGRNVLGGEETFLLYDTFGFPLDLARDLAFEYGITVDQEGFERCLDEQRRRARADRAGRSISGPVAAESLAFLHELPPTNFVGYGSLKGSSRVLGLVNGQETVAYLSAGEEGGVILESTPFYAESGGQLADVGKLYWPGGSAAVLDAQKLSGKTWHQVKVEQGKLEVGQQVEAEVDAEHRKMTARHHSATHLLHRSLREILGSHVQQAGSMVSAERLRFDFNHFDPLTPDQIKAVERMVNDRVLDTLAVEITETTLAEARAQGAMALFQEQYGDRVRLVRMGDFSLELCGGTHVGNTGEIGLFRVVSEAGIGAGIRRVEAVAGTAALQFLASRDSEWEKVAATLKVPVHQVNQRVENLLADLRQKEKEIGHLQVQLNRYQMQDLLNRALDMDGIRLLTARVEAMDASTLRDLADNLRDRLGTGVVVLGAPTADKVNFVATVSKDLLQRGFHAGQIIRRVAEVAGGGGGGRPDMAQAGGKIPEKLPEALDKAVEIISGLCRG